MLTFSKFLLYIRQYTEPRIEGYWIVFSGPLREDQSANWRWFMRRQQLMEPDFLSELLLLIIGAVMSFFLIWTGVIALLRR